MLRTTVYTLNNGSPIFVVTNVIMLKTNNINRGGYRYYYFNKKKYLFALSSLNIM
jgi:hypothetical protein